MRVTVPGDYTRVQTALDFSETDIEVSPSHDEDELYISAPDHVRIEGGAYTLICAATPCTLSRIHVDILDVEADCFIDNSAVSETTGSNKHLYADYCNIPTARPRKKSAPAELLVPRSPVLSRYLYDLSGNSRPQSGPYADPGPYQTTVPPLPHRRPPALRRLRR